MNLIVTENKNVYALADSNVMTYKQVGKLLKNQPSRLKEFSHIIIDNHNPSILYKQENIDFINNSAQELNTHTNWGVTLANKLNRNGLSVAVYSAIDVQKYFFKPVSLLSEISDDAISAIQPIAAKHDMVLPHVPQDHKISLDSHYRNMLIIAKEDNAQGIEDIVLTTTQANISHSLPNEAVKNINTTWFSIGTYIIDQSLGEQATKIKNTIQNHISHGEEQKIIMYDSEEKFKTDLKEKF